jgi:hypothetical protein
VNIAGAESSPRQRHSSTTIRESISVDKTRYFLDYCEQVTREFIREIAHE